MADSNLATNKYLKNRLQYHTASRISIQTGQALSQAVNADGHIVRHTGIWTAPEEAFIRHTNAAMKTSTDGIATTNDLVALFKATGTKVKDLNNGEVWRNTNFPAVELYFQVEMTPVAGSNGSGQNFESYEIVDGTRVKDYIPPTAVTDNGLPVPGYTGRVEGFKANKWTDLENCADVAGAWALAEGNWEFVYISGMTTFHPSYTPAGKGYTKIRLTAFKYIGSTLDSELSNVTTTVQAGSMSMKPYGFALSDMTEANGSFSIEVPGFVVHTVNDNTGLVLGDTEFKATTTKILFEDLDEATIESLGGTAATFTAYSLVKGDGTAFTMAAKANFADWN